MGDLKFKRVFGPDPKYVKRYEAIERISSLAAYIYSKCAKCPVVELTIENGGLKKKGGE